MAREKWRCYRLGHGVFDHYRLDNDGTVVLGGARFAPGEAICHSFCGFYAARGAGPDAFLLVQRPDSVPSYFHFEHGAWYRWVPLYRANKWRYEWFACIRSWGPAAPIVAVGGVLVALTLLGGLVALLINPLRALGGAVAFVLLAVWMIGSATSSSSSSGKKP